VKIKTLKTYRKISLLLLLQLLICNTGQSQASSSVQSEAKRTEKIKEVRSHLHRIREGLETLGVTGMEKRKVSLPQRKEKATSGSLPKTAPLSTPAKANSGPKVREVKETLQARREYFLFSGITLASSETSLLQLGPARASLRTKTGNGFGVAFGKRLGNWTLGAELQYLKQEYDHFEVPSFAISETAWGDRRHYSLALYGGHDFQLHHSWRLHTGLSLGAATRHETVNSSLLHASGIGTIEDRGTTFSGSAKINVDYAFSDLCSAYVGYRFTYIPKLGDFDSLPIHQTELGLRWNL
jgi:hypothetical protein